MRLAFFVYGKLKSNQSKSWMIPFAKTKSHTFHGLKMYQRLNGCAGAKIGDLDDYIIGEFKEIKWSIFPFDKLLLWFLDLNEGTFKNIYKRVLINDIWVYIYQESIKDCKLITEWGCI